MDRGNVEQVTSIFFPENSQIHETVIPKDRNPNRTDINIGNSKLSYYSDEKKGFFFDKDGIYFGKFEKHDLKYAFFKIGRLLRTEKKQKG